MINNRKNKLKIKEIESRWGIGFSMPALTYIIIFLLLPLIFTVFLSFCEWKGFYLKDVKFIGIENYLNLFKDKVFIKALFQTSIYVVLKVIFLNILGLLIALIIDTNLPGTNFLKSVIFIPVLLSPIIIGVMYSKMFSAFGLINQMLEYFHLIKAPIMWLGSPKITLYTIIGATIWQSVGFNSILYYAGLQGIPKELIEAAKVDGATYFKIVLKITLPMLNPVITIAVVLNLIEGFKVFDIVYVMTRGGPNHASEVLATYLYQQAFSLNHFGYASTIAVIVLFLCIIFSILRFKISKET